MPLSRREFLGTTAAAFVLPRQAGALTVPARAAGRPAVIASANGLRGVKVAYELMTRQNADPLDAAIAGVNIQEIGRASCRERVYSSV